MSIQTFVIEHYYRAEVMTEVVNCTEDEVKSYCIAKSKKFDPSEESIDYDTLEAWVALKTKPDSWFLAEFKNLTKPKRGIWWLTVDLDDLMSQIGIVSYSIASASAGLELVEHHHVTLDFGVTYEGNPHCAWAVSEGETQYPILIKGLAYNAKAACLVVELKGIESCNARPHITLATAEGILPVYSNDMLSGIDGAYTFLPLEAELEGQLEFFEFN